MKIHDSLEMKKRPDGKAAIFCSRCGYEFCEATENYKKHAAYRERDLAEIPRRRPASGDTLFVVYQEYSCPGCGVLLEVDNYCPALDSEQEKVLWDIQIDPASLR